MGEGRDEEMSRSGDVETDLPGLVNGVWSYQVTHTKRIDGECSCEGVVETHDIYVVWNDVRGADLI